MPLPKPLNTLFSVFHFVFWFSSLSRKVWTSLSVSVDTNISVFLADIIRKYSDKRHWIENGEGFAVHSSTWPSGVKGVWRSAADWRYQTHLKKYRMFFSRVLLRLFSGLEILVQHRSFYDKKFYHTATVNFSFQYINVHHTSNENDHLKTTHRSALKIHSHLRMILMNE